MEYLVGNIFYVISVLGAFFGDLLIVIIVVVVLYLQWLFSKGTSRDL